MWLRQLTDSNNSATDNPTPSSEEVLITATQDPLLVDPSDFDCSSDSHPPTPKQPHIEESDRDVPVVSIDVADNAKRKGTLNDHFSPAVDYKFPRESLVVFGIDIFKGTNGWSTAKKRMAGTVFLVYFLPGV